MSLGRARFATLLFAIGTTIACANTDTTCDTSAGYSLCGAICCKNACVGGVCQAPAGGTSGSSGSNNPDPECEDEVDFSKTKYCDDVGRCVDPRSDSENCGACGNVCGRDTNGLQKHCFTGKCQ